MGVETQIDKIACSSVHLVPGSIFCPVVVGEGITVRAQQKAHTRKQKRLTLVDSCRPAAVKTRAAAGNKTRPRPIPAGDKAGMEGICLESSTRQAARMA